jgi:hypothetical protein
MPPPPPTASKTDQRNPHQMQHPTPHGQAFTTVGISDSTSFRSGADVVLVAELAGHRRLDTTRRYSLPSEADKDAAVEAVLVDT